MAFFAGLILTSVLATGVLFYAYRETVIKTILEFVITDATGFRTEVETLHHEWPAVFTLRDVKMLNPPGYSKRLFARAPYFYIDLDLKDILKGRSFHIRHWKLIISELHLEKNREGVLNSSLLKAIKKLGGAKPKDDGTYGPGMPFLMDRLEVKVYTITYNDRTGVLRKTITKGLYLPASLHENVTDFKLMIEEMKEKVLQLAGLSRFMMLSPFLVEKSLQKAAEVTTAPAKAVKTSAEAPLAKTGKILKSTAKEAKDKISEVAEATKEQVEGLMR